MEVLSKLFPVNFMRNRVFPILFIVLPLFVRA
jgi:hypothetical protein